MFKVYVENDKLLLKSSKKSYGPYLDYREMSLELSKLEEKGKSLGIMHEPKDLNFDVGIENKSKKIYYIFLASKIKEDEDNLGSHNVEGLPFGLLHESTECTWLVEGYTKAQIVEEMVKSGFTHRRFL